MKTLTFSARNWKYLEIKNEKEVQVYLEYIHPSYDAEWIYINKGMDKLIVMLSNYRTYLYKAEKITPEGG